MGVVISRLDHLLQLTDLAHSLSFLQARQQEVQRDLGARPTAEELTSIKQAEALYNVSITNLEAGLVKVTGDTGMMDAVSKHLKIVMAAKYEVRYPNSWEPQSQLVQLMDVPLRSSEGSAIAASMPGCHVVKVALCLLFSAVFG